MCGIAGYVGPKNAVDVVLDQLKRLEYRGYDSAGVAFDESGKLGTIKKAGKLSQLTEKVEDQRPNSTTAMAHSRWATHGGPTDFNAHPHYDQHEEIALIHNGIIENYLELKEDLLHKGHVFHSETDTEVAAHVIGTEYRHGEVPLEEAVRRAVSRMRGAFAFVVMSAQEPGKLVCARNASPLIIGFGQGENMVASDIPALLPYTRDVAVLEEDMVATVTRGEVSVMGIDGSPQKVDKFHVDWDLSSAEKGGYQHFMLKEIHEQPDVVRWALAGRLEADRVKLGGMFSDPVWQDIDRVCIVACGTAYHAGLMGKFLFEQMLQLPVDVYFSSEFRYGEPILSPRTLAIFVSQSGETADSLAALKMVKARRIRTLGVVNVVGSSIARECDKVVLTQAGPEISVASTKAYTAQCLVLMLIALHIAQVKETPGVRTGLMVNELRNFAELVERAMQTEERVKELAQKHKDTKLIFFLGRNADANLAYEAALKMKEIAYIATQECPAGEMKHGPLALIEPGVLAVFGATDPGIRDKLVSNMREIQARGGHVLAVVTEEDSSVTEVANDVVRIPKTHSTFLNALLSIVPLQLLSYYMALYRGCEIDQPRNLAKSVTVE